MNFLGKWGKKILITGVGSLVLDIIFHLMGINIFDDFGGNYINFAMIIVGGIGMFLDSRLNEKVETKKDEGLSPLMAQAILEEKRAKKIEEWDNNAILEYLNKTLDSHRFSIWVKSREIKIGNEFDINLKINFTDKSELISSVQEITLKDGKKFTQNKHELAIKKEYSEKVFLCANNLIEDLFEKIIKLKNISIKIYFTQNNNCILETHASREQFLNLKGSKTENVLDKLKFFNTIYNFDSKNFDFKEIQV